jgi:hypothetical protein
MEKIDERNIVNRLKGIEEQLGSIGTEQKLQRTQMVGLLTTMVLLGFGLYKLGRMVAV